MEHVSSSPSGNDTLSRSIPTMSSNSGVGMMYSVPELPTCIPSFIASDSTVLAKSGTYRRGMFLGGSFSSSLSELFLCWLPLGSVLSYWSSHAVPSGFSHKIPRDFLY